MKISFLPKSMLGKWSSAMILLMVAFFVVGSLFVRYYVAVPAGDTILQDVQERPGVAYSMLAGFVVGVGSFVVGLIALVKKDFGVMVVLSVIIGLLLMLLLVGEFVSPH